jgi:hypothetical protein
VNRPNYNQILFFDTIYEFAPESDSIYEAGQPCEHVNSYTTSDYFDTASNCPYYNGTTFFDTEPSCPVLRNFDPGIYTVAGGDMVGGLAILYLGVLVLNLGTTREREPLVPSLPPS